MWCLPRIIAAAFDPTVDVLRSALSPVQIGVVISVACMVLPWTIILPPDPFIWAAAVLFPFSKALTMAMEGTLPAMAVPFLLVCGKLGSPILRFLRRYSKTKAILLSMCKAGPFSTTLVVRLGPVPYGLTNYLLGLPPDLDFWRYMVASMLGIIPSVMVIFGRNIKALSDLLQGESVPAGQIVVNLVSLFAGLALLLGG